MMKAWNIVYDENSWFKVLKLIIDCELRSSLGIKLYKIWQNNFRHEVLNKKLVKILDKILNLKYYNFKYFDRMLIVLYSKD